LKKIFLVLITGCVFSALASASIAVVLDGTPVFNGTDYTWTYAAELGDFEGIGYSVPSYFTIYDFLGLDSVVSVPTDWTFSEQLTGVTPSGVTPTDDPNIENVTFYYNGPEAQGPESLGDFVLASSDSALNPNGNFAYQTGVGTTDGPNGGGGGDPVTGVGLLTVPAGAVVPEPKLELVMALGVAFIGLAARRNLRKPSTI